MRIGALLHAGARDRSPGTYVVFALGEIWREQGHEFDVIYGVDPERVAACDVLFNHVDVTRVPLEYQVRGPRVVNAGECSVAKRDISDLAIASPDEWSGAVIVKTDRNHGGRPEHTLTPTTQWARWRRRMVRRGWLGWGFADMLDPHSYPVYDSARLVPRGVWSNPALVVERFVPERDGEYFVIRSAFFLGDRVHCHRMLSRRSNVRTVSSEIREPILPPANIAALRARSRLEYGKIDYVEHDGSTILLDATRTPCYSRPREERRVVAEALAPGLDALLAAVP
jgi:hypothetical protein